MAVAAASTAQQAQGTGEAICGKKQGSSFSPGRRLLGSPPLLRQDWDIPALGPGNLDPNVLLNGAQDPLSSNGKQHYWHP